MNTELVEQLKAKGKWVAPFDASDPYKQWVPDLVCHQAATEIEYLRLLASDMAQVMSRVVVGWAEATGIDLAQHPEVRRVMGRYRAYSAVPPEPGQISLFACVCGRTLCLEPRMIADCCHKAGHL